MTLNQPLSSHITPEGLKAFLAGPYVKGVGAVYAARIADGVGNDILKPDFDFESLKEKAGVPESLIENIRDSFASLRFDPEVAAWLYSAGMRDAEVEKIMAHYAKNARKALLEDPYDMVENVWKVSFFTADKLGKPAGIDPEDPRRLRGALLTAVKLHAERGSLFATEKQAVKTAAAIAGVKEEVVAPLLRELIDDGRLISSHEGIYLPVYFHAERETAGKLANLIRRHAGKNGDDYAIPDADIKGRPFNADQKRALETVLTHPVTVITGGPGTGKTTVVKGIVKLFEDMDSKAVLVAPTGRAAKRLADLAGTEAKTIHRILGYTMGKGYRNKHIDAGILVIDEASMLEQVIFAHLLDALDPDTKIVLVGDTNQLPAIGAGDVLNDLIASGEIPVVRMTENFRQQAGSDIASTAEAIRLGLEPPRGAAKDFILIPEKNPKDILRRVIELVSTEIPKDFHLDPKDIQVVSPQQDGLLGTRELNAEIQRHVNPTGPSLKSGARVFRLGDRVMQKENSSERDVYNGETGWISAVDEQAQTLEVTFHDGKKRLYRRNRLRELTLAYAITVHKLQGSETDYMVFILSAIHRNLLYRNLLYTGVSRARKLCVLVGEERAIETALANDSPVKRNSNLGRRLRASLSNP